MAIKILHIINGEYYAGAERVQDILAMNLPAHGYEVSFACLKPAAFPKARQCQRAPLYRLPMRTAFDLSQTKELIQLIRREKFALIHTHYTRSNLLGALAAMITKRPLVQHVHGVIGFDSESIAKRWLNIAVERLTMLLSRQVIVVSDHLRRSIMGHSLLGSSLKVIHNGVPAASSLAARNLNKEHPVIGAVAFWRPGKGLEDLLHALRSLYLAGQFFTLHLVGGFITPAYEQQIKALAAQLDLLDKIRLLGVSREVQTALRQMDLFVLPSLSEGLPMVILEAMAAGTPVVATEVGGISEAVRSGLDGLLVPSQDHEALAQAIHTMLDDAQLWALCRENAYQRQKSQFSDKNMTLQVAQVYDHLLGAEKGRST